MLRTFLKNTLKLLILLLLFSCKSKEFTPIPLHEEIYKINAHIADDDIKGVILLYPNLANHKDYAYHSILSEFNLDRYNYEELYELYNLTLKDSLLYDGFGSIMEKRENTIIESLLNSTIDEIGTYYSTHPLQHHFLDKFIEETIIANIDSMDYFEIKYVAHSFKNTKFYDCLKRRQTKLKNKTSTQINKNISEYIKSENENLAYLEMSIKTFVITYLYEQFPLIISSIADLEFPANYNEIIKVTDQSIYNHISRTYITDYVKNETRNYFQRINKTREQALSSISLEPIKNSTYLLNEITVGSIDIKYDASPLCSISEIQNEKDAIGTLLSVASIFGGVLLDIADIGYSIHTEKNKSEKMLPYYNSFANSFCYELERAANCYTNKILEKIRKQLTISQKSFKALYYEIY